LKAQSKLEGQPESVHIIKSLLGLVLVEGAQKEWYTTLEDVFPYFCGVQCGAWIKALKEESTHVLASLHCDQKETVVVVYTATSKVLLRSRWSHKIFRCSNIMGAQFGSLEDVGTSEHAPCVSHFHWAEPYQWA